MALKRMISVQYTWLSKPNRCFLAEIWDTSCNGTVLFWKRGRGAAAHLHLKWHARKQNVSASTQNRHFQNDIINYLWGILSWNFTDMFKFPILSKNAISALKLFIWDSVNNCNQIMNHSNNDLCFTVWMDRWFSLQPTRFNAGSVPV